MKVIKFFAYIVLALGLFALIWLCFFFPGHGLVLVDRGEVPDMENITGPIGDFVGGVFGTIFSLVSALLVIVTLELQSSQYAKDRFEQSFFEMLHIHNDNVKGMKLMANNKVIAEGREVFKHLIEHYNKTFDIIGGFCTSIINGGAQNQHNSQQMVEFLSSDHDRKLLEMQIAYGYYFFGSENYHLNKIDKPIKRDIEQYIHKMMVVNNLLVAPKNVLLGHYYRHLYQMITFISRAKCLEEDSKYEYAKQVRAQLDDEEQLLLYYNAMSEIGSEWLISSNKRDDSDNIENMCLLSRFRMIKNIPNYKNTKGLTPDVFFENDIKIFKEKHLEYFENGTV